MGGITALMADLAVKLCFVRGVDRNIMLTVLAIGNCSRDI